MNNFSLNDFFAAFKSLRAGRTQAPMMNNSQAMRGCCQGESYMSYAAYDYPDADVMFDASCGYSQMMPMQDFGCCLSQLMPVPMPDSVCGIHRPSVQLNFNTCFADGPGNDIYDAPGDDVYSFGNRGIIDTKGDDMYVRNFSVNTFNTVNNFYKQEVVQPTVEPTTPSVDPPSPTAAPTQTYNLMPLRNLLTNIEKLQPDGVLSDAELNKAMANPHYADLDKNSSAISSEELSIFNRIKTLNADKDLLSNVIKGDYSNISDDQMSELSSLSDAIKELTQRS